MAYKGTPHALSSADLAAVATSGSATDLTTGTLPAGRMPALTGDVTTSAGAVATAIGANKVTLAMMATIAQASLIGGASGAGTATPTALTGVQVSAILSGSNDTITTAGSNVTDLDTSSLDGDNDGDYWCQDTIIGTGGAATYTLQPNASSASQKSQGNFGEGTTIATEARTDLLIGTNDTATSVVYAQYFFMSKSGRTRMFVNHMFEDSATIVTENLTGIWSGAGNITSLRRHSSVASRIATGSFGRIRRMRNLV